MFWRTTPIEGLDEIFLGDSPRTNQTLSRLLRYTTNVAVGSISTELRCPGHIRFTPGSDRIADVTKDQRSPRKKSPTQKSSSSSSLRFGNFQQPVSLGLKVHNGGNSNEVRFDDCYRSCHCDASSGGRCWSSSWSRRRWREHWRKPRS